LLACFNRPLAQHLSNVVDGWESLAGAIEVTTFHALCRRAFQALGREYEPPSGDDAFAFWNTTAPTTLLEAVAEGVIARFDAIVIDEAQDFAAEWMSVLEDCLRDKDAGHLAIFYDPAQKIFGRATGSSEVPPTFTLMVNFRSTRAIAEVVKRLGRVEMDSDERCPAGEPPVVHDAAGRSKTRAKVDEVVDKLLRVERLAPDQITILTPHTRENSSLADMETVGGAAIADDASDRAGKILHTTISRYKGLESDVILLVDVDSTDERSDRTACYVAASRARHVLHIWARGDWLS
jgi:DNA helicase IV